MTRPAIATAALAIASVSTALAGDLNPPAGPVAPTLKTLFEVEPRTPIFQSDIPLNITEPGSYYLAENVSLPARSNDIAIFVAVSNVAIDLNGFTIDCQDVANDAFFASGVVFVQDDGLIRNGSIINTWRGVGAESTRRVFIESVRVLANADGSGIKISAEASVVGCAVRSGSVGIDSREADNFLIRDCQVTGSNDACYDFSFCDNGKIENCTAFIGIFGFRIGTSADDLVFTDCVADNSSTGFSDTSGQTNFYFRNLAILNNVPYTGVPNINSTPALAGPWDNIAQ